MQGRGRRRKRLSRAEAHRRRLDEQHLWKLSLLREFVAKHGWSEIRRGTVVPPGVNLYSWVHGRRTDYQTGEIRDFLVPALEAVPGWSWSPAKDRHRRNIDNLRTFVRKRGWQALTVETEVDGVKLSGWCATRRLEYRQGILSKGIIRALEAIPGWSWEPLALLYADRLGCLRKHVARHGWEDFTIHTQDAAGVNIGKWANHIRDLYRNDRLPDWVVVELEAIPGWMWEPRDDRQRAKLDALRRFVARSGWDAVHRRLVSDGMPIGQWFYSVRDRHKDGVLPRWLTRELESIPGWSWGTRLELKKTRVSK